MLDIEIEKNYYPNGKILRKAYYLNGKLHNENGPAVVWYYENGDIREECYYLNGEQHNENGPALLVYFKDRSIDSAYYINGNKITDELQLMVIKGLSKVNN